MNVIEVVEGVLLKLSAIPGLGFLASYVREYHGRKSARQQQIGLYKGYVSAARGAVTDVAQAARGTKKQGAAKKGSDAEAEVEEIDDDYEEEEDDDFESYGF